MPRRFQGKPVMRVRAYEQAKQTVIEPEVAAEEKKSEQSLGRTQPAESPHRVIDPVTGACVPQDSARIAEQESLSGRGGPQS
jgi:hypothetical protein